MKAIFLIFVTATSLLCSSSHTKQNAESKLNTIEVATSITSIDFTKSEIRGESHYGFKYDFDIHIDSSTNLDILKFCRTNFPSILNGRVTEKVIIDEILKNLNNDNNVRIDQSPKGLRLFGAATELFDSVELEIFLKESNLLKLDLKFYNPL